VRSLSHPYAGVIRSGNQRTGGYMLTIIIIVILVLIVLAFLGRGRFGR
jgi:hypothetical protein